MIKLFRLMIPALLLLASACGAHGGGSNQMKTYNNDGYLGITNTNPNLPMTPTYHTYEVDTNMMRDAVVPIAGVRKARFAVHGTKVNARLTVPKEYSEAERARVQNEALQALSHAVPRYNFKVIVKGE